MLSESDATSLLRKYGIAPTAQRVAIARLLMARPTHMSAEEVYRAINAGGKHVSKATVYNTLGLMSKKGVIREVIADSTKIFYDSNTEPHHHLFDVSTGELKDIDAAKVEVAGLPALPQGAVFEGVDVIVRFRSQKLA